jgi:pimeloyl-ACP methyl ester carboxylesterase
MEMMAKNTINPVDKTRIRYYVSNPHARKTLLIAGGLNHSALAWGEEISPFQKNFKTITMDLRGTGKSDKPTESYSMEKYTDDILAILDNEGVEKTHLLGHSYGSVVVQEFYNQYPERVKSLILVSAVWSFLHTRFPQTETFQKYLRLLRGEASAQELSRAAEITLEVLFSASFLEKHRDKALAYLNNVRGLTSPEVRDTLIFRRKALREYTNFHLQDIKVPVLIVHGEKDAYIPPENARVIHRKIPRSKLILLKNTGHHPLLESYPETADQIVDFIQSTD